MSGTLLAIQLPEKAASPRLFYWITDLYKFLFISVNNSTHSSGCVVGNLRYCFCHISLIWITIYCWVSGHGRFYNTGSLSRKHMRKWCSYVSGTWKKRKVTRLLHLSHYTNVNPILMKLLFMLTNIITHYINMVNKCWFSSSVRQEFYLPDTSIQDTMPTHATYTYFSPILPTHLNIKTHSVSLNKTIIPIPLTNLLLELHKQIKSQSDQATNSDYSTRHTWQTGRWVGGFAKPCIKGISTQMNCRSKIFHY